MDDKKQRPSKESIALSDALDAVIDNIAGMNPHAMRKAYRAEARALCEQHVDAGKMSWRLELARRAWMRSRKTTNTCPRLCRMPKPKAKPDPEMRSKRMKLQTQLNEITNALRPQAHAVVGREWLLKQKARVEAELAALTPPSTPAPAGLP